MTTSRARLTFGRAGGTTRLVRAEADAPQRWSSGRPGADGRLTVTQQLLGDGVFAGDQHRTWIDVQRGAHGVVRAVAATPLRGPGTSSTVTQLRVAAGGSLLYLPGALVPHAAVAHTAALRAEVAEGAMLVVAAVVTPGRSAMEERSAFTSLRLRTVVRASGETMIAEDGELVPGSVWSAGPALFGEFGAFVSVLAMGGPPLDALLPAACAAELGVIAGTGQLRAGGQVLRALCPHLGAANRLIVTLESTMSSMFRDQATRRL